MGPAGNVRARVDLSAVPDIPDQKNPSDYRQKDGAEQQQNHLVVNDHWLLCFRRGRLARARVCFAGL